MATLITAVLLAGAAASGPAPSGGTDAASQAATVYAHTPRHGYSDLGGGVAASGFSGNGGLGLDRKMRGQRSFNLVSAVGFGWPRTAVALQANLWVMKNPYKPKTDDSFGRAPEAPRTGTLAGIALGPRLAWRRGGFTAWGALAGGAAFGGAPWAGARPFAALHAAAFAGYCAKGREDRWYGVGFSPALDFVPADDFATENGVGAAIWTARVLLDFLRW